MRLRTVNAVDLGRLGLLAREVRALRLRVRFDDGFVVYLNGDELARPNMPEGEVTERMPCTS